HEPTGSSRRPSRPTATASTYFYLDRCLFREQSRSCPASMNIYPRRKDVASSVGAARGGPAEVDRVLLETVRHRACETAARLRQLRHHRATAEAGPPRR